MCFYNMHHLQLNDWFTNWMTGWLVDWHIDWLCDWISAIFFHIYLNKPSYCISLGRSDFATNWTSCIRKNITVFQRKENNASSITDMRPVRVVVDNVIYVKTLNVVIPNEDVLPLWNSSWLKTLFNMNLEYKKQSFVSV